jgi:hypothetical protein
MSLRVYVRVDKVTELDEQLCGEKCHMKLILGQVIMRTKSEVVDDVQRTIAFKDMATGRLLELFVFAVKSVDHLRFVKLRIQLRRDRFLLRSHRVGEAVVPLAMLDMSRSLVASFPLRSGEDGSAAPGKTYGKVLVRVEMEEDSKTSASPTTAPRSGESHEAPPMQEEEHTDEAVDAPTSSSAQAVVPRSFSMIRPTAQRVPSTDRSDCKRPGGSGGSMRSFGTQTDRLSITTADIKTMDDDLAMASSQAVKTVGEATVWRLDPPPPADVFAPRRASLPVDVLAQQYTAPAHPTDEVEGLILYCEQSQRYQRELEATLTRHHLDVAKTRLKAIQRFTSGDNDNESGLRKQAYFTVDALSPPRRTRYSDPTSGIDLDLLMTSL